MPRAIAAVVASGHASLIELDTVYGAEDLYLLLEIAAVDAHNRALLSQPE